jgi:molybdate-binding protein
MVQKVAWRVPRRSATCQPCPAVPEYADLSHALAVRIAAGELAPGAALPSVRSLAAERGIAQSTVLRAYRELAAAGLIERSERRSATVAASGPSAAMRLLRGRPPFRLAGSDDPALDVLLGGDASAALRTGQRSSFSGLTALWKGDADGATIHLRHTSGEHNAPFARALLRGRQPTLVHLWRREQGLVLPPGNPLGLGFVADLRRRRVARRAPGTGTRALLDRLLIDAHVEDAEISGPTLATHLEVALAVASGSADAGVAVRSTAVALDLDFVPVAWEDFDLALPATALPIALPLVESLRDPAVRHQITQLGGYDLSDSGVVRHLGPAED